LLEVPSAEPTNDRVEPTLRPAVIARKASQCSKNEAGAYAFFAFKSQFQAMAKWGAGVGSRSSVTLFRFPKGLPELGEYRPLITYGSSLQSGGSICNRKN
jgi:hypothetical protein